MKSRRAEVGEQLTVFWFLFLLFIIVVGLAGGTYLFFGAGYDFREIDAAALNYKINKCLSENEISLNQLEKFESEFYAKCKINKDSIANNQIFIFINSTNEKNYFRAGKGDLTQCALQDKNENYPRCESSSLVKNGETIFIQTGSNQKSVKKTE